MPEVTAKVEKDTWVLPRSVDSYKYLYRQTTKACVEQGMAPMDALLVAAHMLKSIGIHVTRDT